MLQRCMQPGEKEMVALSIFAWGQFILFFQTGLCKSTCSAYFQHNSSLCWLGTSYGVIWSFIGPMLLIIAVRILK